MKIILIEMFLRFYFRLYNYLLLLLHNHKKSVTYIIHYHKTVLNLNIESLKNAYNVIPNLKTAQYSINVVNVGVKQWNLVDEENHGLYNW